ncbi:polyphosphate kinase [Roseobacter sp. AzwK-3b]|uniref:VOC family protein n=1 Tax=Roseobacter sp. AzwK-3b TaxID=351016 RepID=UPI0001569858|nr:VOC family protein [Roseobacter sp. AzwK-3b]EDM71734.1 polyphosphate kinase [Roseobacter sp. AzwK-3b]
MLRLDHLAVAARDLEEGRAAVEAALGVRLQPGGQHAHFGTHNLLLGLEDGLYLEVIAIDPEAPAPEGARWFDLDRFDAAPRLQTWICRSDDLGSALVRYPQAGAPVALARGDLRWRMAVPRDGRLPFDGVFPALMQWECNAHPAERLTASGCGLARLVVRHPEAGRLADMLGPDLSDARVVFEIGAPSLRAEITTPGGLRVLE